MSQSELDQLSPQLAAMLRRADDDQLRRVATAASDLVLEKQPISDTRLDEARKALTARCFGPSHARTRLEELVAELDDTQWELQERFDQARSGIDKDGHAVWLDPADWTAEARAADREQAAAFGRARAANTVLAALDEHSLVAADEALYQAHAALGERDDDAILLCKTVEALLR